MKQPRRATYASRWRYNNVLINRLFFDCYRFPFAISAYIYFNKTGPKLHQECKTGNGNLKCLHYNFYFTMGGFVITKLHCIEESTTPSALPWSQDISTISFSGSPLSGSRITGTIIRGITWITRILLGVTFFFALYCQYFKGSNRSPLKDP